MTPNQSALLAQMQHLAYSQGTIVVALRALSSSKEALRDALLYLDEQQPTESQFVAYVAERLTSSI